MLRSNDGGKLWRDQHTVYGDHHDLWIDPERPKPYDRGDDGGAQVSFDAGANWVPTTTNLHHRYTALPQTIVSLPHIWRTAG